MAEGLGIAEFRGARGYRPAYYSPGMDAARPLRRDRRLRRGKADGVVNTRLVRAGSAVVLPALVLFLFSISSTGTLPRSPLEPVFDARTAASFATTLSTEFPSRTPGTAGAAGAALWYRETISAFGLPTEEDVWSQDLASLGRVELRNVVTVVPGKSPETIVVVAHRDNSESGRAEDNASGTSALLELARGFAPQENAPDLRPERTLVLLSTDAGAFGGAGAERFAERSPLAADAIAVVVLDQIDGRGRPEIALAGDVPSSPARVLVRTAAARVEEQTGVTPALPAVWTQLNDFGIPFAEKEQGRFLARGLAALTLTAPRHAQTEPSAAAVGTRRLGELGRATESLIGSLDTSLGEPFRTPDSLFFTDRAASGWAVRLLLVVALVPFALGAVDLLVRAARRGVPFRAALRSQRTRLLIWLFGGVVLWIGAKLGVLPTGASLPLPPETTLAADHPFASLSLIGLLFGLGWLAGRRRLVARHEPGAEERLAGFTVALALLGAIALVLAATRPYALCFCLPSLYAWLWMPLGGALWTRIGLFLAGLVGPLLGLFLLARQLALPLLEAPLYVIGLATVGYVPLASVLLAICWLAAAAQIGALAVGRYAPYANGAEPPPAGLLRESIARLLRVVVRPSRA